METSAEEDDTASRLLMPDSGRIRFCDFSSDSKDSSDGSGVAGGVGGMIISMGHESFFPGRAGLAVINPSIALVLALV